jgi:3-phenylpropionate/trans-cinnamate dioxygenase ferredoxin reductase subunit
MDDVVIIGSGYIGMEVSASLTQAGKKVTVISPDPYPWKKFVSEQTGRFLQGNHESHGVEFVMNDKASEFVGDGKVQAVKTEKGLTLPAEMVVAGIGVTLNTKMAEEAGLALDENKAIKADRFLRSESDPDIYVAGDIAAFDDVTIGRQWHAEHYLNAKWTGPRAGKNMAGENEEYKHVPYFFSDLFDLSMVLRGDPQGGRMAKIFGDRNKKEFVELYANDRGEVVMGLAFSTDSKKTDKIADALEAVILDRPKAADVTAADVAFEA